MQYTFELCLDKNKEEQYKFEQNRTCSDLVFTTLLKVNRSYRVDLTLEYKREEGL